MSKFEEKLKKILKETLMDLGVGTPSWPRWMPSKMASRYSGLSDKTLRRLAREGEIYAVNIGGKKFLFDKESIDEYLLKEKAELQIHLDRIKDLPI